MVYDNRLAGKQLDVAYWYVTHKMLMKKIVQITLIVISALLFIYYVYIVLFDFVVLRQTYDSILNDFSRVYPDYAVLRQSKLTQQIKVQKLNPYPGTEGKYDIVAEVSNNKADWWATFDYQFQVGDKLTEKKRSFILPGETKYLIDLAIEDGDNVTRILFDNIIWKKQIKFPDLLKKRLNLEFQNVDFLSSEELGIGSGLKVSRAVFDVFNNSPYGYQNINLIVFLRASGEVVAVSQASSGIMKSDETKKISAPFFQILPKINSVDIIPEVNILDDGVYLKKY